MISYCVACYRPAYARQLIQDLIRKSSAPYEILLWINVEDVAFDRFLQDEIPSGTPLRIIGRSADNIGMAAYPRLFEQSKFDLVAQIDDDVVCVGRGLAQTAKAVFDRFPHVGMLSADVWQDEYTTGARPPMEQYRLFDGRFDLYDGPIDGWFAVYRRSTIALCRGFNPGRYGYLGAAIRRQLIAKRRFGLLCRRMKVFHVTGPYYASYFGALDSEIAKYELVGRADMVHWYAEERDRIPPREELAERVRTIQEHLA